MQADLADFVGRVRQEASVPLAVGFGIGSPEQAANVGQMADGVIVGSALINAVDQAAEKPQAAKQFVQSLQQALKK
jgi:tryptophan synthase alpha chain